jgi:molecular chaperone GrpE
VEKLSKPPAVGEDAVEAIKSVHRDFVNLHEGLQMTEGGLIRTLEKHGVERYDPSIGKDGSPEKFDPMLHEAMFLAPKPGAEDGSVMHTQRKGISLNGRVLRVSL